MSEQASYFSRFFAKFAEVIAVGLATAVSGYLIAHLGGLLSSPTPAAIQIAPSASGVSRKLPTQTDPPVSAETNEQRLAPSVAQPARPVNATKAVPPPKRMKTDTSATESQPRNEKSVEAQVRDALANIDANRPTPPDVPPQQVDGPPGAGTVVVVPRAADQPRPVQQAPVQPGPLTAVERKSRPVAAVEELPASRPARPARQDNGFSAIERDIPYPEPLPEPTGEVPRPPMPVGQ